MGVTTGAAAVGEGRAGDGQEPPVVAVGVEGERQHAQRVAVARHAPGAPAHVRGGAARQAGRIYLGRGDRAKAEAVFRHALTISPAAYAWRNESLLALSGMLIEERRTSEAVALFEAIEREQQLRGNL